MTSNTPLYNRDYALWLSQQLSFIEQGQFERIDVKNISMQLKSWDNTQRFQIRENVRQVMTNQLINSARHFGGDYDLMSDTHSRQVRIVRSLRESPSLKNYFDECIRDEFPAAVKEAKRRSGRGAVIPDKNQFSAVTVMGRRKLA